MFLNNFGVNESINIAPTLAVINIAIIDTIKIAFPYCNLSLKAIPIIDAYTVALGK